MKNGCPTVMVGAAVGVARVYSFLRIIRGQLSALHNRPFPDLFGWMAGETPVNLLGWQGRMDRAYGESAMVLRILFRCG